MSTDKDGAALAVHSMAKGMRNAMLDLERAWSSATESGYEVPIESYPFEGALEDVLEAVRGWIREMESTCNDCGAKLNPHGGCDECQMKADEARALELIESLPLVARERLAAACYHVDEEEL